MSHNTQIEFLEGRTFLSANAFINANDVLHVQGYSVVKNTITVGYNADGSKIDVSIQAVTKAGTKNFSASFDATKVLKVRILGGAAADNITIDQTNLPFNKPTAIDGGLGNDTINAGDENDWIRGGPGNDTINAGAGNDKVFGGLGADVINGGDGNDTLWGGGGNDVIDGGAGNDKLGGVIGSNTLTGGSGIDTFVERKTNTNTLTDFSAGEDIIKNTGLESADPVALT